MITLQPYLFFAGRCDEAIEFYRKALGADVGMLMRFNESPDPIPEGEYPAGYENRVMHGVLHFAGQTIMVSDGCGEQTNFDGFSLSLAVSTQEEAERYFQGLQEGGEVTMPLGKTFWSPCFGMVKDRFGLGWMINVVQKRPE